MRFHAQQAGQAADLVSRLGLQDFPVRSIHYGLALEDDFRMWLTHNVVFKMKPGVDWFLLMPYMNGVASRFFDEAYGNIRMELDDLGKVVAVANAIEKSGLVEFCHPDFYAPITHYQDPLYPQQFQMHNTGQTIDGPEAWAITTGSSSVIVAVIDDGVENHEDMNDANGVSRVIGGYTPLNGGNGAPISNFITLDLESPIQQAYIADLNGRVLKPLSVQPGRQEFSVAGLAEGVYLIVVRTDEGVYSTRLVKVN